MISIEKILDRTERGAHRGRRSPGVERTVKM
jgi:hypothetical protein